MSSIRSSAWNSTACRLLVAILATLRHGAMVFRTISYTNVATESEPPYCHKRGQYKPHTKRWQALPEEPSDRLTTRKQEASNPLQVYKKHKTRNTVCLNGFATLVGSLNKGQPTVENHAKATIITTPLLPSHFDKDQTCGNWRRYKYKRNLCNVSREMRHTDWVM